jgi:hypothetical protein
MNWKLIFLLSLFGLAMAFATLTLIPSRYEYIFWIVIFILCAYIIARLCSGQYFLHGFLVSLVNCVWITIVHVYFFSTYIANHPDVEQMSNRMMLANHPRWQMLLMGPMVGVLCGIILGLFAWVASKLVKRPVAGTMS